MPPSHGTQIHALSSSPRPYNSSPVSSIPKKNPGTWASSYPRTTGGTSVRFEASPSRLSSSCTSGGGTGSKSGNTSGTLAPHCFRIQFSFTVRRVPDHLRKRPDLPGYRQAARNLHLTRNALSHTAIANKTLYSKPGQQPAATHRYPRSSCRSTGSLEH
jgi:hypothetical protein